MSILMSNKWGKTKATLRYEQSSAVIQGVLGYAKGFGLIYTAALQFKTLFCD